MTRPGRRTATGSHWGYPIDYAKEIADQERIIAWLDKMAALNLSRPTAWPIGCICTALDVLCDESHGAAARAAFGASPSALAWLLCMADMIAPAWLADTDADADAGQDLGRRLAEFDRIPSASEAAEIRKSCKRRIATYRRKLALETRP